uniref:Uncharacterized protein n=1 Tax=Amphimedon queenslandica TaxID=400682 RepID=A0A1X7USI0_AMPQE
MSRTLICYKNMISLSRIRSRMIIIIKVVEDPDLVEGERVHYLPHHAVVKRDKQTTKLRAV